MAPGVPAGAFVPPGAVPPDSLGATDAVGELRSGHGDDLIPDVPQLVFGGRDVVHGHGGRSRSTVDGHGQRSRSTVWVEAELLSRAEFFIASANYRNLWQRRGYSCLVVPSGGYRNVGFGLGSYELLEGLGADSAFPLGVHEPVGELDFEADGISLAVPLPESLLPRACKELRREKQPDKAASTRDGISKDQSSGGDLKT